MISLVVAVSCLRRLGKVFHKIRGLRPMSSRTYFHLLGVYFFRGSGPAFYTLLPASNPIKKA